MISSIVAAEEQRKANLATATLTSSKIKGSEGVKAIIRRGGQTIKDIGERCDRAVKSDANVEQGTVVITGPKDMVLRAIVLCKNAVFGKAQDVLDLKLRSAVNIIFGKDFGTIRDLQNSTGAKLDRATERQITQQHSGSVIKAKWVGINSEAGQQQQHSRLITATFIYLKSLLLRETISSIRPHRLR